MLSSPSEQMRFTAGRRHIFINFKHRTSLEKALAYSLKGRNTCWLLYHRTTLLDLFSNSPDWIIKFAD
ncbi:hypothetical protein NDU88_002843 [Pleurodeles waltl]|uniref:Uncharacterized protein n=1 Tax=Pleurodeles waltl TaxID=8319 RepID=A0AAV7TMD5_PLEWA|nr:hypothetical protein NDU88_002842 [Pleurodeles waltl]KAJ1177590.1 hypothetical protein NDU88_002843 [Pleurodeles waltl]